ncbi:MAG: biopolymer transporter ExbD [Phycisphaerae bacterium]|nr:biopolymer transporter ExbD [Phycisphaerae bacterium]
MPNDTDNQQDSVHLYVSERKKRKPEEVKLQPPLTPMIDVTFQLLLYFLLTSTFRKDEGQIPGTLPATTGQAMEKPLQHKTIKVKIAAMGVFRDQVQYTIGSKSLDDPKELLLLLQRRCKSQGADTPVVIDPGPRARWKYVVNAYNQAVHAKFKNIGFAPSG